MQVILSQNFYIPNRNCYIHDLVNTYLNNPPLKVNLQEPSILSKYLTLLQENKKQTLNEYSQYAPIFSEVIIKTDKSDDKISLNDIDENIINIYIFKPVNELNNIPLFINKFTEYGIYSGITYNQGLYMVGSVKVLENLLENVLAYEIINIYNRYFGNTGTKIEFDGNVIKVKPDTLYYVLYSRGRKDCEVYYKDYARIKELFEINLMLNMYNSELFMYSDYSIRSVSISGLSVQFNSPDTSTSMRELEGKKYELLNSLSEDLPERF